MNMPPPLPSTLETHGKLSQPRWVVVYMVTSALVLVILLGVLITGHPGAPGESIADAKQRTDEYLKQGKIHEQEARRQAANLRIQGLEGQAAVLRQALTATRSEKEAFTTKMNDYAMDHKAALLAIGCTVAGAGIALDDNQQYTENQKTGAKIVGVVGGLYAITHHEECLEVTDRIAKAMAIQAEYDKRIKSAQTQIATLEDAIVQEQRNL